MARKPNLSRGTASPPFPFARGSLMVLRSQKGGEQGARHAGGHEREQDQHVAPTRGGD
jgi:hypothetical protein